VKIDQDYLKRLLETAQASLGPTFTIDDLEAAGLPYDDDAFEFHMMILNEQGLIVRDDGDAGFGMFKSIDGHRSWSVLPLRLSASGHELIEALENKKVWATLKREFKEASFTTLKSAALELAKGYLKQQVQGLLGP